MIVHSCLKQKKEAAPPCLSSNQKDANRLSLQKISQNRFTSKRGQRSTACCHARRTCPAIRFYILYRRSSAGDISCRKRTRTRPSALPVPDQHRKRARESSVRQNKKKKKQTRERANEGIPCKHRTFRGQFSRSRSGRTTFRPSYRSTHRPSLSCTYCSASSPRGSASRSE